jgi:hypothetical protein
MSNFHSWLAVSALVFFLFSCTEPSHRIVEPAAGEQEILINKGEAIAISLVQALKSELIQAIDAQGVEAAVAICNIRAIPLTEQIEDVAGKNITIRRISTRYRNPSNEPDEIEMLALAHFETLATKGEDIPLYYTQKVITKSDTGYYYYKPMKIESLCLLCHGDDRTMAAEVKQALSSLYPDDRATGYTEGEFRGLIRVRFASL